MLSLILTLSMLNATPAAVQTAQVRPCVWPNTCAETPARTAQVQTCQWPHTCASNS